MLTYRHGPEAHQGGLDITLSLTPGEAAALGVDAGDLADWLDTALFALALLRTGRNSRTDGHETRAGDLYDVIGDLDARLLPRLEGIRDAAVRAHAELGGSHGDLALAMEVPRSTAQSRRKAVTGRPRSRWEQWATSGGTTPPPAATPTTPAELADLLAAADRETDTAEPPEGK